MPFVALTGVSSLQGKRVVVTRARGLGSSFQDRLLKKGAVPVHIPAIEITPFQNLSEGSLTNEVARCNWLFLPSPSVINTWCSHPRLYSSIGKETRVATMGKSSAIVYRNSSGRLPHFVYKWNSECNLQEQLNLDPSDVLLILGSNRGPGPVLAELLSAHANSVYLPVIEVACSPSLSNDLKVLLDDDVHAITFTSASSVHCFMQASLAEGLRRVFHEGVCIACIGRTTAAALREYGIVAKVVCLIPSEDDLMASIGSWFSRSAKV